jgi:DNA-binding NtrC family response regulator
MMNILLVDDEQECIDTIARRLRQRGITADCANSGRETLARLKKNGAVDIIILDVGMPYPDGLATLETIKKKYPLIEVIMLTGDDTVRSAVAAIKLGAYDYLMKPCVLEDLMGKMEQAFARKQERQAKILDVRMKPYITEEERAERIARILAG